MAAGKVLMQQGPTSFADGVGISPMHQAHQDGVKVEPLLGKPIFITHRTILIWHFHQHAGINKLSQPIGENMARDVEPRLEIIEAANAQEAVAQDQ